MLPRKVFHSVLESVQNQHKAQIAYMKKQHKYESERLRKLANRQSREVARLQKELASALKRNAHAVGVQPDGVAHEDPKDGEGRSMAECDTRASGGAIGAGPKPCAGAPECESSLMSGVQALETDTGDSSRAYVSHTAERGHDFEVPTPASLMPLPPPADAQAVRADSSSLNDPDRTTEWELPAALSAAVRSCVAGRSLSHLPIPSPSPAASDKVASGGAI
jgi:hypothetical protein